MRIRQLLLAHRTVVVTGEAGGVDVAVAVIAAHRPDVIFLDIHMKPRSGFDPPAELPQTGAPIHVVAPLDIVLLKDGRQTCIVRAASIRAVQARGHMSVLRLEGGEGFEMHGSITGWAKRLPAEFFVRLSRGLLVNRSLVAGLTAIDRNRAQLFLQGCTAPLVISRLEAARLRKSL